MSQILQISFGAILGALFRYQSVLFIENFFHWSSRYGILLVNIIGCFCMGLAYGYLNRAPQLNSIIQFGVMIGFLGALTTFSSFSLDILKLFESGSYFQALAYLLATNILSITACFLGYKITQF